jgi:hypothetical protein
LPTTIPGISGIKTAQVKKMNDSMRYFPFGEVFRFQRGSRLIEAEQIVGETAYISSTKQRNGISAYVTPPDSMTVYRNKLTLSNSGSVGHCFYHDYDFVASDHVTVIWIKDESISLTRNIALYLKPIIEGIRYKYNFGREIGDDRLWKEKVLLPTADGKPDWPFMESYIQSMMTHITWSKIPTANSAMIPLAEKEWAEYAMDRLFVFENGRRLVRADMVPGEVKFIGAISSNNGVRQLIDKEPDHEGNCITVNYNGSVGEAFYQESPFCATDDVKVLYPQDWWTLNRNIAMFLITVIKENRYLFSYGRKWNTERMKKTKLKLPALANGKPDFAFMERYILSLPYADRIFTRSHT